MCAASGPFKGAINVDSVTWCQIARRESQPA
jgi:hypothetical protein